MVNNIYLVGPMGAGKTTIGKLLAKALRREFIDSDREIEARTGASIPLIFELEQEAGFRKRESAIIDELTQREGIVLATGGGAVLLAENREFLKSRGHVIYLCAPLDKLVKRTARDTNRPLLQQGDAKKIFQDLLKIRDPLYREVAHMVLETDNDPVKHVVYNLVELIKKQHW